MEKKLWKVLFILFLGLGLVLVTFPTVYSQDEASDEFTLEEITVTAEKRTQDVQKTAIAVTAIAGDAISEKALNTLGEVMKGLAGVEVAGSISGGQIYIRGVGAYGGGEPATAVMLDDVYSGRSLTISQAMYDVERVEVLRGPQGTLYGRNATGGLVNVNTKNPIDTFETLANFQLGDYNLKHFDGAVNMPISEKWAARVALLRETRDGYLSCGGNASNIFSTRIKLSYKPNDDLSVIGSFDYTWQKGHGNNTVPVPGSAGKLPTMFPWADSTIPANGWIVPAGALPEEAASEWDNDEWHPAGYLYSTRKVGTLAINWDLGWGQVTIIPSYSDEYSENIDNMLMGVGTSATKEFSDNDRQTSIRKTYSVETRLASPADSAFTWMIGVYGMKMDRPAAEEPQDPTTYDDSSWHYVTYRDPDTTYAIFGQTTYPVTDQFRVTGGLRYSTDENGMKYRYGNSNVDPSHPLYDGDSVYDSGMLSFEQSVSSLTYKAGIEFDAGDASMLYAQVATGFKQGGLNQTAPPSEYKPEELVAYEVGAKNRFLDGRMQLNLEGYYYQYTNMQAQFAEATTIGDSGSTGGRAPQKIFNAETGTNKGFDVEFDYLFTKNDKLKMTLAYINATYGKLTLPPNPDWGSTDSFPLTGRTVAMSPKWVFGLGYDHTWYAESGASVIAGFDTKISSGYYTTAEQYLAGAWQESYTRSNILVSYFSADGKWSSSVWAKNLEDDAQTLYIVPFYRRFINDPRTFGMTISFNFR